MSSASAKQPQYPYQNDPIWSRSERAIACAIFDAALKRELQDVMQMANQIKEPTDVWELERYLTQRRNDILHNYDFRCSRQAQVLGTLLAEGRITDEDLRGLREDKRKAIRSCARVLPEGAA